MMSHHERGKIDGNRNIGKMFNNSQESTQSTEFSVPLKFVHKCPDSLRKNSRRLRKMKRAALI